MQIKGFDCRPPWCHVRTTTESKTVNIGNCSIVRCSWSSVLVLESRLFPLETLGSKYSSTEEKIGSRRFGSGLPHPQLRLTWQHILENLPSFESQSYADLYVICPPSIQDHYDEKELLRKVEHPTKILNCSTDKGLIHISKHIGPEVLILGHEYSWAIEPLRCINLSREC